MWLEAVSDESVPAELMLVVYLLAEESCFFRQRWLLDHGNSDCRNAH